MKGKKMRTKLLQIVDYIIIFLIIASYIVSLTLEILKLDNNTYMFGNTSQFLYVFWSFLTTVILVYAIFIIKRVISNFPDCQISQKMMLTHLFLFCTNELLSMVILIWSFKLTHYTYDESKNHTTYITMLFICAIPMMLFVAYLLFKFSKDQKLVREGKNVSLREYMTRKSMPR